jgi:hypothetical protein
MDNSIIELMIPNSATQVPIVPDDSEFGKLRCRLFLMIPNSANSGADCS